MIVWRDVFLGVIAVATLAIAIAQAPLLLGFLVLACYASLAPAALVANALKLAVTASAAPPPSPPSPGLIAGAAPVVSSNVFENRWGNFK